MLDHYDINLINKMVDDIVSTGNTDTSIAEMVAKIISEPILMFNTSNLAAKLLGVKYNSNDAIIDLTKRINHAKCDDNVFDIREELCSTMVFSLMTSYKLKYDLLLWAKYGNIDTEHLNAFIDLFKFMEDQKDDYYSEYKEYIDIALKYAKYNLYKLISENSDLADKIINFEKYNKWSDVGNSLWLFICKLGLLNDNGELVKQEEVSDECVAQLFSKALSELTGELAIADDVLFDVLAAKRVIVEELYEDSGMSIMDDEEQIDYLDEAIRHLTSARDKIKNYRGY